MAVIRASSDLRNKYNEISDYCNTYNEPVFITRNGAGDLVVMSNAEYERLVGMLDLYRKLERGMSDFNNGRYREAAEVFEDMEKNVGRENL
jgi:prevent-host-death family protein